MKLKKKRNEVIWNEKKKKREFLFFRSLYEMGGGVEGG